MRKAFLLATVALAGAGAVALPAFAQNPSSARPAPSASVAPPALSDPFAGRAEQLPAALALIQGNGIKITSLGDQGGLRGYLLEDPAGRMQVVYLNPEGTAMVVGVMQAIAPDGKQLQNVTTLQFAALRQRFETAKRQVEERQRAADEARRTADQAAAALQDQQRQIGEAARQFGGAPVPAAASTPSAPTVLPTPSAPEPTAPAAGPRADSAPAAGAPQPIPASAARFATSVQRQAFLTDVEKTAYFTVGREGAPTLYMVADPQCPHCHIAWTQLRPLVAEGKIAVKIILIGALAGSQPIAERLISQENPGAAWWAGEGSQPGRPVSAGAPEGSAASRQARSNLAVNFEFIRNNGISSTPWMAYVGRDGKVYQMSGDREVGLFVGAM